MVKDQDYLKKTASFCIDLAKKLGATDSTAAVMHSISETVNFRNKKLDESDRSDSLGVSLTTYIGKKKSSISSSNLTEENIKTLVERCIETTKITPEDEYNSLPDKDLLANKINDLNLYDDDHIENDEKIEYLKEVEEAAFQKKEIINTETGFSESKSNFILASSDGFLNGYKSSSFSVTEPFQSSEDTVALKTTRPISFQIVGAVNKSEKCLKCQLSITTSALFARIPGKFHFHELSMNFFGSRRAKFIRSSSNFLTSRLIIICGPSCSCTIFCCN